jgi:predicted metalloprotease with PDZ domain
MRKHSPVLAGLCLSAASLVFAQAPPSPIRYVVRFPAPQTNYLEVEAVVPTDGRPSVEMMMAVWTPGSYLVREYERNVEAVRAANGSKELPVEKTLKNRWRITTGGAREVRLTYKVYSHEMSVRNNWVDAYFAMVNGAQTFMTIASDVEGPAAPAYTWARQPIARAADVTIELPSAWKTSVTGMPDAPDGRPNHFRAPDYDTLVDSPIIAGNPTLRQFTVSGKTHILVDVGEGGLFDGSRAAADLQRVVETDLKLWGSLPYSKYVFFNVLTGGLTGGSDGLEHKNSVMMTGSRWATTTRANYLKWLSTASHEFFHLWNVKRLRPIELGPFDYERENYPRSLWIAEGVTDYYADVQLRRAGLITTEEYLRLLSAKVRDLQTTPGRLVQTAEMASFDAWIKQYRPDENSLNTVISYYTKGALVGWLLDGRVRSATNGAKSLDDVMRLAFDRYSGARGYTPSDFRKTANDVAGMDLSAWFNEVLDTTGELDYRPALDWFGLHLVAGRSSTAGWLGAQMRTEDGRLVVAGVPRGTPAFDAGLNAGDELLAIDGFRVMPDQFRARMATTHPGDTVTVLVTRLGEVTPIKATLSAKPVVSWIVTVLPEATAAQKAHLASWLGE